MKVSQRKTPCRTCMETRRIIKGVVQYVTPRRKQMSEQPTPTPASTPQEPPPPPAPAPREVPGEPPLSPFNPPPLRVPFIG
jgi:hypothetical protein